MANYHVTVEVTMKVKTLYIVDDSEPKPSADDVKVWLEDDLVNWKIHNLDVSSIKVDKVDDD